MRKRTSLFLLLSALAADFLLITGALLLAYGIRFTEWVTKFLPVQGEVSFPAYAYAALLFGALWCFFLLRKGAYSHLAHGDPARLDRYLNVWLCGIKAAIFLLAIGALWRELLVSRYTYVLAYVLAGGLLILWREITRRYLCRNPMYRAILICPDGLAEEVSRKLRERIVGMNEIHVLPWLLDPVAMEESFACAARAHRCDMVFLLQQPGMLEDDDSKECFFAVLNACESCNIAAYMVPDVFEITVRKEEMYSFSDVALIRLRDACIHPVYLVVKRLMDVTLSLLALLAGMPLWLLIALVVKLQDKGPVFFFQCRIGCHGAPFDMIKFRTMAVDADQYIVNKIANGELDESLVFNIRKDPRVTRFGALLRRWSLDEIPQLLNVLKGEMSLVGPRPERKELVDRYSPLQRRRLKALPGITGLQQVISRGDPSLNRRIQLDLLYISRQSLFMDTYILLRTVVEVIRGSGMK